MRVNRNQVIPSESTPFGYIVEASDLEWPVGSFPRVLQTDLGNGLELIRQDDQPVHIGVMYQQLLGVTSLLIIND